MRKYAKLSEAALKEAPSALEPNSEDDLGMMVG